MKCCTVVPGEPSLCRFCRAVTHSQSHYHCTIGPFPDLIQRHWPTRDQNLTSWTTGSLPQLKQNTKTDFKDIVVVVNSPHLSSFSTKVLPSAPAMFSPDPFFKPSSADPHLWQQLRWFPPAEPEALTASSSSPTSLSRPWLGSLLFYYWLPTNYKNRTSASLSFQSALCYGCQFIRTFLAYLVVLQSIRTHSDWFLLLCRR